MWRRSICLWGADDEYAEFLAGWNQRLSRTRRRQTARIAAVSHRNLLPGDPCERLAAIGVALFGRRWKTRMAAACGVSRETITNWYNRKRPPLDLDRYLFDAVSREIDRAVDLDILKSQIVARGKRDAAVATVAASKRLAEIGKPRCDKRGHYQPMTKKNAAAAVDGLGNPLIRTWADLDYLDPQVRAIVAEYLDLPPALAR
jgi:hypothetical protein